MERLDKLLRDGPSAESRVLAAGLVAMLLFSLGLPLTGAARPAAEPPPSGLLAIPTVTVNTLITADSTPPLSGTVSDPEALVSVSIGAQGPLSAVNNGDGTWTLPDNTLSVLADGVYDVQVSATNADMEPGMDITAGELTIASATSTAIRLFKGPGNGPVPGADTTVIRRGSTHTFSISVTNPTPDVLRNVSVFDALAPVCNMTIGDLRIFESFPVYRCSVSNVQANFTNEACAVATVGNPPNTSTAIQCDVSSVEVADIDIRVQAEGPDTRRIGVGSDAVFDVVVTNNGATDLTGVVVSDSEVAACSREIGNLAVGASVAYSCVSPMVLAGFENVATVEGFRNGFQVADSDTSAIVINRAPVAENDSATTNEDTPADIPVLANDTDADGDTLVVQTVTQPARGATKVNPDGTVRYTPNADFDGFDNFEYTVSDGEGGTDTASVIVEVLAVNDPPVANDDSATTEEDTAVTIRVLLNDRDVDGDPRSVQTVTAPGHGTVTINDDGTVTYTPGLNFNGIDSFNYTLSDGKGGTDTASVIVTVLAVNDPPVANDDSASIDEDTPVNILVLGNDRDVDGDTLLVQSVTEPGNGVARVNANGTVTYTPFANFNGIDAFTYTVSDGKGGTDTATVTVTVVAVNDVPVATDDETATDEDTPLAIAVLANDTDVDGDALSVQSVTQPARGATAMNADGTVSYTPNADFDGFDNFEYTVSDGQGGTDTASVIVTVLAVNDPPVANDDNATTEEDTPVTIRVLLNDSDVDGDPRSVQAVTVPDNGTVVINADGTVTYMPRANFIGTDTFEYTLSDGQGGTDTATVTVTVTAVTAQMRVSGIFHSARFGRGELRLRVRVYLDDVEEKPVEGARVSATWTLPDGSTQSRTATSNDWGRAIFRFNGAAGTYHFAIDGVDKAGYTLNTDGSILGKTITN